jgi:hypothetical protein
MIYCQLVYLIFQPKESKNGLFMPFELKLNMKLAPERRALPLLSDAKDNFDEEFDKQVLVPNYHLICVTDLSYFQFTDWLNVDK